MTFIYSIRENELRCFLFELNKKVFPIDLFYHTTAKTLVFYHIPYYKFLPRVYFYYCRIICIHFNILKARKNIIEIVYSIIKIVNCFLHQVTTFAILQTFG